MIRITVRQCIFVAAVSFVGATTVFATPAKSAAKSAPAKSKGKAAAKVDDATLSQETFPQFCEQWMGKLAAREQDNKLHRNFKADGSGFNGTYVGYSSEHSCTVSIDGKVPIGRVLYKEVTYKQEGGTLEEAKQSSPQPVEIYEVTELFQFNKHKWSAD